MGQATTLGTKPAPAQEKTTAPTWTHPVGPSNVASKEYAQTIWTATLTADPNSAATALGCDDGVQSIDNCSAALTNTGFTYEGTAITVSRLLGNKPESTGGLVGVVAEGVVGG